MKSIVLYCAVCALLLGTVTAKAVGEKDGQVEQSTESPIADMALVDPKIGNMQTESVKAEARNTSDKEKDSQQHTIADFIIHPLIALKPHVPEPEGKQADTSSTTPSPWQLFGFNTGQGLGSQVSSLAGSVTGWLGNRIQLPGLVDTPVRESTTTTTTTTTPKPDVVVRVKQRASTKKPLISIRGDDERPYRKTKRPNKYNNWQDEDDEDFDDEEEEEEEVYSNNKRRRYQNNNHNDDDDEEEEDDDDEDSNVNNNEHDDEDEDNEVAYNSDDEQADEAEEEEEDEEPPKPVKQNQRRRHPRPLNNRRRINHNQNNNQRRRFNNNNNSNNSNTSRKQQQQRRKPYQESEEIEQDEDDDEQAEPEAESEQQQNFYYNKNPSSKRSQTEQNFIQRGQDTLIKQIQQFTGGQTPAEVTQTMRKNKKPVNKKQRNQATLIIKHNGQAVYVAPELLQVTDALSGNGKPADQHISVTSNQKRKPSHYPQPPLSVPYKRKGKPAQYITIPWSQLGISPPDDLTALTNGIQTQPLILNIPQSAIDSMQYPKAGKRKQAITPDSVPLLADASIMDIFKPPRIPPARTPPTTKPMKKVSAQPYGPVVIATKTGPTRIRPGTIVEKAPADENTDEKETSEEASEDEASPQLIVIGDESGERQLTRTEYRKILDFFNNRAGRQLNDQQEQFIPVKVVEAEDNTTTEVTKMDDKMEKEMEKVPEIPVDDGLKQESGMEMEVENVTEIPIHISLKQESGMEMEVENVTEIPVDNSLKQESGLEMEMDNSTEIPIVNTLKQESGLQMEMENSTEIPVDNSLKQESPVDDVTESVVENATESPINV